jgi:hypothetical protein
MSRRKVTQWGGFSIDPYNIDPDDFKGEEKKEIEKMQENRKRLDEAQKEKKGTAMDSCNSGYFLPCEFIYLNVYYLKDLKKNEIPPPFFSIPKRSKKKAEFEDWLNEFPLIKLERGTKLIHAGTVSAFLKSTDEWKTYEIKDHTIYCWWNLFCGTGIVTYMAI